MVVEGEGAAYNVLWKGNPHGTWAYRGGLVHHCKMELWPLTDFMRRRCHEIPVNAITIGDPDPGA